jgi:hypothetical protein
MNKKENKKPTVQYFFVTSDERKNYSRKYKFENKTTLFPVFNLCLFLYRMYIEIDVIYVQKTESQE